jgi:hypothetical protein
MPKHDDTCGCTGRYVSSPSLLLLIEMVERAEAKHKAMERQEMLEAAARYVLDEGRDQQLEEFKQEGHDVREVNQFIRELAAKNTGGCD